MKANELRHIFFDFFRSRGHEIVSSAPMVIKDDPTLMFTNAGMNQFKDIFLGNSQPKQKRVANSQKCLRVSGKHNDLEEVGHDTYHHTMFEMLGNWSFGDYFKKEAIDWAWEFLVEKLGIDRERLYVTIFEGDEKENLDRDQESFNNWALNIDRGRILEGSKKDNFWEMGDTGPCGPCSEIHVDIRNNSERSEIPGHELVNKGHPQVIEIWNLVFIQYNRRADGTLEHLPSKHVDTGMGFERLCMVIQGKKSNYETDLFQPVIGEISAITGKMEGLSQDSDIAMRVIADHLRAVAFSVADGQLPSNNKAGYVIRRILRRAVRYGYNYLGTEEPFIYRLVPVLVSVMGGQFPELNRMSGQISRIILEEETAFLKTLGKGLKMINKMVGDLKKESLDLFPGKIAFELYDTYGFPADLTQLILKENGIRLDVEGFEKEMNRQKSRSRADASLDAGDWNIIREAEDTLFTGYDRTEDDILISKFRIIKTKGKEICQLVFNKTPFYAEAGGQAGDTGYISSEKEKIEISDTIRENNLILHISKSVPAEPELKFMAYVDTGKRLMTAANHTATHLLHYALRSVLGEHVEQKGSLVTHEKLRFDFSHFGKPSREELRKVEDMANRLVRKNLNSRIVDNISLSRAREMGAMALFGEKYGESVRVVGFGDSLELCGGTHVESTASIGIIKIISESAIASGVRRLEAITAEKAGEYINEKLEVLDELTAILKSQGNIRVAVEKIISENSTLKKTLEKYKTKAALAGLNTLEEKAIYINKIRYIAGELEADSADTLKTIALEVRKRSSDTIAVLGASIEGKAALVVMVSDLLAGQKDLNAVNIIREIATEISGSGGGQPFLATAGGRNPDGIARALLKAEEYLRKLS